MHRALLGLVIVVAACGKDSSGPQAGFECLGAALPTKAPATITVGGQILQNALAPTALSGAEIIASRTGTDTLAADTSNTPGFYSLSITTGGTPVDGFLRVSHGGSYITTYAYPARPLAADDTTNVLVISPNEFTLLSTAASAPHTAGDGTIVIVVRDCDGKQLAGATVASNPSGLIRYNAVGGPSTTATSTYTDGVAYIFNVAAGNVTIMGTASGHALRQHVVNARADAITLTELKP
ncbi:MAG TPA: hypothetical protein VG454_13645 [Gemmatimonadales bacterium]|nr:hypothetical protein [Gemmatimonadales bacterium]